MVAELAEVGRLGQTSGRQMAADGGRCRHSGLSLGLVIQTVFVLLQYETNFHKEFIISMDFGKHYRLVCIFHQVLIWKSKVQLRSTKSD
jgi:hypothetical protein